MLKIDLNAHNNYANMRYECKTRFDDWFKSNEYHQSNAYKQINRITEEVTFLVFDGDIWAIKVLREALDEYLRDYYYTIK